MDQDRLDDSIELLFNVLEDLNRVHDRREGLDATEPDDVIEEMQQVDDGIRYADLYREADGPQLRMALRSIDEARDLIADEIDESSPSNESQ